MKLKGLLFAVVAEIQEAVSDEIKKVQREEFLAAFQKLCYPTKACIYANGAYFELKTVCVFLLCLRFFKKSVLKPLGRTVNVLNSCLQHTSTKFLLLEAVGVIAICN